MKKQLRRHVSQFLVYVLVSNLFIVFDTRAMAVPVVVPVAAETLMTAGVYLAGIVSSVIRNKCYMPEVPGSQIGKAGIDPSQPVRVVTPSVAVDVIKSVVVADKALCVAIGAQVASGTVATPTDGKNTAAVEVAGQLAQVGAHVGVVEKTAGVSIANQEYIKLAQEQLVVRCPGIYSPTPYVPRPFRVTPIPGGAQVELSEFKSPYFSLKFPSAENDARWARSVKLGEVLKMQHRLRHNPNYKARIVGQTQEALECLLQLYDGSLTERMSACTALQSLHIDGPLNGVLVDIAGEVRHHYVHSNSEFSVAALVEQTKAASIIETFVNAIERNTGHAIRKEELINATLYKQIKHYEAPHHFAHDLSSCLKACKKYDFEKAETFLVKYGENSIFRDMVDLYKTKYESVLKEAEAALYDVNGIVRVAKNDPAYCANMAQFRCATAEQKIIINQNLLLRHHLKTMMHEKWGISKKAPDCVHEALYNIIGADGSAFADVSTLQHCIEGVIKVAPENERKVLIDAFYLPNGVLKEFAQHFKDAKHIKMPKSILTKTYDVERQKLNDLMCELTKSPSKGAAIQAAREHLHDWLGAKNTKDAIESKGRFDRAYTNVFNTYPGGVPLQAVSTNVVDAQSSMPMPPGPELEPKNKLKPVMPDLQPKEPKVEVVATWDMPETGKVIHGRYYTKHALERMAPPTKEVIEELEKRAINQGYVRGSDKFKAYVQPRNIPPSVVEDAIKNGTSKVSQNNPNVFEYITDSVKVFVNQNGNVISVYPQ